MIISKTSGMVTVYDKDGNEIELYPIDAREQLELGLITLSPMPYIEAIKAEEKVEAKEEASDEYAFSDEDVTAPKRRNKKVKEND